MGVIGVLPVGGVVEVYVYNMVALRCGTRKISVVSDEFRVLKIIQSDVFSSVFAAEKLRIYLLYCWCCYRYGR